MYIQKNFIFFKKKESFLMLWTTRRILQTTLVSFIFVNSIPKSVNKSHRKKEHGLHTERKKETSRNRTFKAS